MFSFLTKCYNPLRSNPVRWGDHVRLTTLKVLDPQAVLQKVRLNETTEEGIIAEFGPEVMMRRRFSPVYPARYGDHYYPVDKMILYRGADVGVIEERGMRSYTNRGTTAIAFYFHRGVVKWYSIYQRVRNEDGTYSYTKYTTPDALEADDGNYWPYAECFIKFYELHVLCMPPSWSNEASSNCPFDKPDFEDKLRADGYYARLENGYTLEMRMPEIVRKEKKSYTGTE